MFAANTKSSSRFKVNLEIGVLQLFKPAFTIFVVLFCFFFVVIFHRVHFYLFCMVCNWEFR